MLLLLVATARALVPETHVAQLRVLLDPASVRPTEATYATQLGEQHQTVLPDQSLVDQNTSTVIRARISPTERELTLSGGEVLVNVAPNPRIPFVVHVEDLAVSTHSGKVLIRATETHALLVGVLLDSAEVHRESGGIRIVNLRAGDIATFAPDSVHFEQTSPEEFARLTAWRGREIWLLGDTLAEAIAEFNRYSPRKLVIVDRRTASMRVSGRFYAQDVDKFVRALKPLHVDSRPLTRGPRSQDVILLSRS